MNTIWQRLLVLAILVAGLFFLGSCDDAADGDGESDSWENNINWEGQESELNGVWSGEIFDDDGSLDASYTLRDGYIININFAGFVEYNCDDGGGIGKYSFDGTNFSAEMNDGATGAPCTHPSTSMVGTLAGNTLAGTRRSPTNSNNRFRLSR